MSRPGYTTYRRYECRLCDWKGMFTGGLTQRWMDILGEAQAELEAHFREEHGFEEENIWRLIGPHLKVATGYLKDLEEKP